MKKIDLINFYNKFSIVNLDSIGILLQYNNNSKEEEIAYKKVYEKKFDEKKEEFNGINDYDYLCKIANFEIIGKEKLIKFNNDELLFLREIIENAINKIKKDSLEGNLISILNEYIEEINKMLPEDLLDTELEKLFRKYNYNELDLIKNILKCVKDSDVTKTNETIEIIQKEQLKKNKKDFVSPNKPFNYILLNIIRKNKKLSLRELNYLYKLFDDASFYLSSVQEYANEYNFEIGIESDIVNSVYKLCEELYKEIENRYYPTKKILVK